MGTSEEIRGKNDYGKTTEKTGNLKNAYTIQTNESEMKHRILLASVNTVASSIQSLVPRLAGGSCLAQC